MEGRSNFKLGCQGEATIINENCIDNIKSKELSVLNYPPRNERSSNMNEIIKISYDSEQPTVLGRDLHKALEVKTAYKDWFPRMCDYGFEEGKDYTRCSFLSSENQHGGQNKIDHQLTIPMAKEICMLQRSEKGKMFRQYPNSRGKWKGSFL